MPKQILETVNFKNFMADKMFEIENDESIDHEEKRIAMSEAFMDWIKDKRGRTLEPYLSEVSINTHDGSLIISVRIPPD